MVHIYCGDGKGKTTASVGLAVRGVGAGKKVLFSQFFKDGSSSEISVLESINGITCRYYAGKLGFYSSMNEETKQKAKDEYEELFTSIGDDTNQFDMIILDEMISTYNFNMVEHQKVINYLLQYKDKKEIILTGRNPAKELVEIADYISDITKLKHPYDKGILARKGIEF